MSGPPTPVSSLFTFDNTYARDLPGSFTPATPEPAPSPVLLRFNVPLAEELGLDPAELNSPRGARIFAGNELPEGAEPIAQAYAGHQFGGFSPQLGDGRALLLGEVIDRRGRRRDIAFKGSGRTPFSRRGDGKAAVGPVLREYLMGEAMHALGIPTTRALAAVRTGEMIMRDGPLPGAVLTRVAASHIRVGTFEYFASRGDYDRVRALADYAIARHDPQLVDRPERYLALLAAVAERQAALVAQWMLVGFIHGVMNTDNMAVSGETIDYGPCAFMEAFDPKAVFSSIDSGGRYAYRNQPAIAQWNLTRFAETLLPFIEGGVEERAVAAATEVLQAFAARYEAHWLAGVRAKLGLSGEDAGDALLAGDWLTLLETQAVDFTLAWRRLADVADGRTERLDALFPDAGALGVWLARWRQRSALHRDAGTPQGEAMRRVNPLFIPRNHLVEDALAAASEREDMAPFERLLDVIVRPFEEREGLEWYASPAPAEITAAYKTFCGT
jgi:serine/tyrosine/threonine adenylyltransferase